MPWAFFSTLCTLSPLVISFFLVDSVITADDHTSRPSISISFQLPQHPSECLYLKSCWNLNLRISQTEFIYSPSHPKLSCLPFSQQLSGSFSKALGFKILGSSLIFPSPSASLSNKFPSLGTILPTAHICSFLSTYTAIILAEVLIT